MNEEPPVSYWLGVDNPACVPGETIGIAMRADGLRFLEDANWIARNFKGANTKKIRVNKGGSVEETVIPDTGESALGAPIPQIGRKSPSEQQFEYVVTFDLLGCYGMYGIDQLSGTWSVKGSGATLRFETGGQQAVSDDALKLRLSGWVRPSRATGREERRGGHLEVTAARVTVTDLRGGPQERDLSLRASFFVTLVPSDATLLPGGSGDQNQ